MSADPRTVRIFLSSTFRDFGEERDLLVRRVDYVELLQKCDEVRALVCVTDRLNDLPGVQSRPASSDTVPRRMYSLSRKWLGYWPATGGRSGVVTAKA